MGHDGFRELVGLRSGEARDGTATVLLDAQQQHVNPLGSVHGGVVATLVDVAMAEALWTVMPEGRRPVTIEMKLNYMLPARPGVLIATARVRRHGQRLAVVHGDVVQDGSEGTVAEGLATFAAAR